MTVFELKLEILNIPGEKRGWTAAIIKSKWAQILNPGVKTSYRLKGSIDHIPISQKAILPIGNGDYVLPFNSKMQQELKKKAGDCVKLMLEVDRSPFEYSIDLLACLELDEKALFFFSQITPSHKRYFSNWIESAKTIETKTKRLDQSLYGLAHGMKYDETIRFFRKRSSK